jgi:hypothetical protein
MFKFIIFVLIFYNTWTLVKNKFIIGNIKRTTPLKIERKLNAMVPISAAGVPFMPKAARSD